MIIRPPVRIANRTTSVTIVLSLFVGMGITQAHQGHPPIPTTGATVYGDELLLSEGARDAVGLTTAKVSLADMPTYIRVNGRIAIPRRQQSYVTTLVFGVVDEVLVRPGDELKRGQVLARISSLELEQIQLDLLQADSDFTYLSELYFHHKKLSESGSVSRRKFLETTQGREEAASRLQVATTKLKAFGFDDDTLKRVRATGMATSQIEIRSPIQGSLVNADIRAGQSVDPQEQLFHIVDNSMVWCVADVLETDMASVELGQPVSVDVASFRGSARQGRVDHIGVSVDPNKRAVHVVIELENKDLKLRPGMSARIAVQVAKSEQAIVCPRESLIHLGDDRFVLLKRGEGKFVRRKVDLGRIGPQYVEVIKGVFPGDQVTRTGTHLLGSLFDQPTIKEEKEDGQSTQQTIPVRHRISSQLGRLTATGIVERPTVSKFYVTSRIGGRITRIFVGNSQPVKQGDPLIEIESMELFDLQLELFQQDLKRRWMQRTLARLEPLSESGGVPKSEVRRLKNDFHKLQHQFAMLKRRLVVFGLDERHISRLLAADVARTDLSDLVSRTITIRAPHDGLIASLGLAPGQMVDPHEHQLFEIHDTSQAWVKAYLFEHQAQYIARGQQVEVRFASDPTLRASGRIVRIAPTSAQSRRVFPVWIELDKSPGLLREGMLTRLLIDGRKFSSNGEGE